MNVCLFLINLKLWLLSNNNTFFSQIWTFLFSLSSSACIYSFFIFELKYNCIILHYLFFPSILSVYDHHFVSNVWPLEFFLLFILYMYVLYWNDSYFYTVTYIYDINLWHKSMSCIFLKRYRTVFIGFISVYACM